MESIVYAVDWNHSRENVFSGAAWLDGSGGGGAEVIEQLRKPTALVCSAKGAERTPLVGGRKRRDDLLLEMIRATVERGGTVLIPTDTSARVLELAYVLEHAWRKAFTDRNNDNPLKSTKLYLASKNVGATMRYARSMLEWMDENVIREFEAESTNAANKSQRRIDSKQNLGRDADTASKNAGPFDFQYLRLLERRNQIEKITSTKAARVILASDTSLEWGFSKDILRRIAADPSNLIILTEDYGLGRRVDGVEGGLGTTIWNWYQERRDGVAMETGSDGLNLEQVYTGGREMYFRDAERVPLEGKELLVYQQYLATQRQLHNTLQMPDAAGLETSGDALDDTSSTSSSSDESDSEKQGKALNTSATAAHYNRNKSGGKEAPGVNVLLDKPGLYDWDVRGKKGREQMFPFVSKRRRLDDYGELIRPEDYLRAEERDVTDGQDAKDEGPGRQTRLGQKRKWEDSGLQSNLARRGLDGANKRRQQEPSSNHNRVANGTNGDPGVNGHNGIEEDEFSDDNEPEADDSTLVPSKVVFKITSIQTYLKIAYVDCAGVHDQRSLSMLIPLIQPKKLILTGGTISETTFLANDFLHKLKPRPNNSNEKSSNDVFTPLNGQTVDASVDTNAWTVKLSEALLRRFHWQNVRGLGIVTLMGHLASGSVDEHARAEACRKKRQRLLKRDSEEAELDNNNDVQTSSEKKSRATPILDVIPPNLAAATRSVAQPLHIGDLRLADLRRVLQGAGHTAEFRGEGTLLIDELVAVRKSGTGRVEVEGGALDLPDLRARNMEGSFYAVKRRIYEGLALIAGG